MTHPSQQPEDWERLARRVSARMKELQLGAHDVQARGGPSIAVVSHIRNAKQTIYRPSTLAELETALDWAPGSIRRVLTGSEPVSTERQTGGSTVTTAVVERGTGTYSRLQLSDGTEVLAWTPGNSLSPSQEDEVRTFFEARRAG
jgi:hypothetical protein